MGNLELDNLYVVNPVGTSGRICCSVEIDSVDCTAACAALRNTVLPLEYFYSANCQGCGVGVKVDIVGY